MTWTKVDDGLHSHPKVLMLWQAGHRDALGLHLLAFSYIGKHLTDGLIHRAFVEQYDGVELAEQLVQVGLWEQDGENWRVHDWAKFNPTRADVEKARRASTARSRRARAAATAARKKAAAK